MWLTFLKCYFLMHAPLAAIVTNILIVQQTAVLLIDSGLFDHCLPPKIKPLHSKLEIRTNSYC